MIRKALVAGFIVLALSGCTGVVPFYSATDTLLEPCASASFWGVFWSPTGDQIASLVYASGQEAQIMVMNPDGSHMRAVGNTVPGGKDYLSWSPDGQSLAFSSRNRNNFNLYSANLQTGVLRQLTARNQNDVMSSWSADSQQIAYVSLDGRADPGHRIYVAEADGTGERLLAAGSALVNELAWSPDGKQIGYSAGAGAGMLTVISPDGGSPVVISDGQGDDQALAWSPDSQWIAFLSYRNWGTGVYAVRADGSHLKRLSASIDSNARPMWVDAEHVAYLSPRPANHLMVANVQTGEVTQITDYTVDGFFNPPSWSPDGLLSAVVAYDHSNPAMATTEIFIVNRFSGARTRITDNPGKYTCIRLPH